MGSTEFSVASLEAIQTPRSTVATAPSDLEALLSKTPTCFLQPYCFFVSWQGVLTLAYSGFPRALIGLKEALADTCTGLPPENPGSKWPKTTLGALQDGTRLTPEQLQQLNAICKEESAAFVETDRVKDALRVWIDRAAIVLYECRSLERTLVSHEVLMSTEVDPRPVDIIEQERVQSIVAEAYQDDYWYAASRDGNRTSHYRGSHIGATLMHKLAAFAARGPDALSAPLLPALVHKFREHVDAELPGLYSWFAESSLHVTLRSLKD